MPKFFNTVDFTDKKFHETKKIARNETLKLLYEVLVNACGADKVTITDEDTLAIAIGTRTGKDGKIHEVCSTIKIKGQNPESKTTKKYLYEEYRRDWENIENKTYPTEKEKELSWIYDLIKIKK